MPGEILLMVSWSPRFYRGSTPTGRKEAKPFVPSPAYFYGGCEDE